MLDLPGCHWRALDPTLQAAQSRAAQSSSQSSVFWFLEDTQRKRGVGCRSLRALSRCVCVFFFFEVALPRGLGMIWGLGGLVLVWCKVHQLITFQLLDRKHELPKAAE